MVDVFKNDPNIKFTGLPPIRYDDLEEQAKPTTGETYKAAFSLDNTIGAFSTRVDGLPKRWGDPDEIDYSFDPFENIAGYEEYSDRFIYSSSESQNTAIKKQIDQENQYRETLQKAGFSGVVAQLAAGVLDPINLVPVGGAAFKAYSNGGSILRNAAAVAWGGALGATTSEIALHQQQYTRTFGETAANIAASSFLGGVLGGAAGSISKARFNKMASKVVDDMEVPAPDEIDLLEPSSITLGDEDILSVGAAKVDDEDLGERLFREKGVKTVAAIIPSFLKSPMVKMSLSKSINTRRFTQMLVETPFKYDKNQLGLETHESIVGMMRHPESVKTNLSTKINKNYKNYIARMKSEGQKPLNYEQFKIEVSRSIHRVHTHPIPEVVMSGKSVADDMWRPTKKAIHDVGLWPVKERPEYIDKTEQFRLEEASLDTDLKDIKAALAVEMKKNKRSPSVKKLKQKLLNIESKIREIKNAKETVPESIVKAQKEIAESIEDSLNNVDGYFPHYYRSDKVVKNQTAFTKIIEDWVISKKITRIGGSEFDLPADEIAEAIVSNIISRGAENRAPDILISVRGSLRSRELFDLPLDKIEEFIEMDVEKVVNSYVRTVYPDIYLKKHFGTLDLFGSSGVIEQGVRDDYRKLFELAETEKQKHKLERALNDDLNNLRAVIARIRREYGRPDDPDSILVRVGRQIRNWQTLTKLGGVLLSSFTDASRVTQVDGFFRAFGKALVPAIKGIKSGAKSGFGLAQKELQLAGTALDIANNSSMARFLDETEDFVSTGTKIEKGLNAATNNFFKITFLNQWTQTMKVMSGIMSQGKIIRIVNAASPDARDIAYLRKLGISQDMQKIITKELKAHSEIIDDVPVANTEKWNDKDAVRIYRQAIAKEVDNTVITPNAADLPLWASSEWGKMIAQFKTFSFAATNRILIAGVQEFDRHTAAGYLRLLIGGMMTYAIKQAAAGKELSDDPRVWIAEGVDRSGMIGILAEMNNVIEKATRGQFGINKMIGASPMSRYASRSIPEAVLGASIGTMVNLATVSGAMFSDEDFTKQDIRAFRRILPWQNVFYLRGIFDKIEESF